MRSSQPVRLGQVKPHEALVPHTRTDHPQAEYCSAAPQSGPDVADVCRALEVSATTYHRWQQLYGGMKATEAKRLKELEQDNTRLKWLLANA